MKTRLLAFLACATCLFTLCAYAIDGIYVWKGGTFVRLDVADIVFKNTSQVSIGEQTLDVSDIDSITFLQPEEKEVTHADTLYIIYNGGSATVQPANVPGVTVSIVGADVELTNQIVDRELTFVLSGESESGSLVYNGEYKTCIRLNGLRLKGSTAEAINVKCGKRIALELAEGTENELADCSTDHGQKAAFHTKGHLEVSGGGTLRLKGNVNHALHAKEYLLVKRTTGHIDISGAANDGIHTGEYFQMNGGRLTMSLSGNASKGIKSKGDVLIRGGELSFTQSGKYRVIDGDPAYCTTIKADGNIHITGGNITITNTAEAGKGLSADGSILISEEDATVTMAIQANGAGGTLDMSRNENSENKDDGGNGNDASESYRVFVSIPSSTGSFGGTSSAWKSIYLYQADGTRVATLTKVYTVRPVSGTTRTFYCYDFGQATEGTYYFASDNYTSRGDRNSYAIRSTTFSAPASGSDGFYTISTNYSTSGTTRTYTLTDVTKTYAGGTITAGGNTGGTSPTSATVSASCIKSDNELTISGGTFRLSTTGSRAKAVKAKGLATIQGGELTVTTVASGAEGLESKTSIDIRGGKHYFKCYDDCINSSGNILFNGGITVCHSTNNDAVDSNAGRTGAITIGNGVVLAFTSKGSPEEGLDCDNNSYIQITGTGIGISAGGSQGGGGSWGGSSSGNTISGAKQGYNFVTSTISYATGRYYTLADASGKNLVTYSFPVSINSTLALITATGMTSGRQYTIKYSTTPPTDADVEFHGLYLGSTATGTSSVTSFTAK